MDRRPPILWLAVLLLGACLGLSAPAAARPVNPLPTSNLLLEEAAPLAAFDLDRGLTRLCRAGRFRQHREPLFIVRLGGFVPGSVDRKGVVSGKRVSVRLELVGSRICTK